MSWSDVSPAVGNTWGIIVPSFFRISSYSDLATAFLRTTVGLSPELALFGDTKINGFSLGDVDPEGAGPRGVNADDALEMLKYAAGTQDDQAIIDYIEGVMVPYMLDRPDTYAAYLTSTPNTWTKEP